MKREDIDRIVLESFKDIEEEISIQFFNKREEILSDFRKADLEIDRQMVECLSCIITAQTNAINAMREILYKIFCKDEEETKHTTNGGNEHEIKP